MLMPILTTWTLISALGLLGFTFYMGRGDDRYPREKLPTDEMREHLVYGLFYANPKDGRGWVPKIYGYGWTVNLRTRKNVNAYIAVIVMTLAGAILSGFLATQMFHAF